MLLRIAGSLAFAVFIFLDKFFVKEISLLVGGITTIAIATGGLFVLRFFTVFGSINSSAFDVSRWMTAMERRIAEVFDTIVIGLVQLNFILQFRLSRRKGWELRKCLSCFRCTLVRSYV